MSHWKFYEAGTIPGDNNGYSLFRAELFSKVYHVAHIETAFRIMRDNKIKSGLIYDKSILNSERICVSWLSPNEWVNGFRYGNISFTYNFENLIKGKNIYWVEVIRYSPDACRFLITDRVHPTLEPYNPDTDNGPWRRDISTGKNYRKTSVCLEFMFEEDLPLPNCEEIKAVKHHDYQCCVDPDNCTERGMSERVALKYFLASVLSQNIPIINEHLTVSTVDGIKSKKTLHEGIGILVMNARGKEFSGQLTRESPLSEIQVRASLNALANNLEEDYNQILSQFENESEYVESLKNVCLKKFKLVDFEMI